MGSRVVSLTEPNDRSPFSDTPNPSDPPVTTSNPTSKRSSVVDRSTLRSALKSAATSNSQNLARTPSLLRVAFDSNAGVVGGVAPAAGSQKPVLPVRTETETSGTVFTPTKRGGSGGEQSGIAVASGGEKYLSAETPASRPLSGKSPRAAYRSSLKMRPISANEYLKEVKLSGFEFRRNPAIESLTDRLIETRTQETEHLNRLLLLRLTNPWSSIKNSELLFTPHAWTHIQNEFGLQPKPRPPSSTPPRPKTSPSTLPNRARILQHNPATTARDMYFAKLAIPRPKHYNDPLPPEIPTPKRIPGPPDLQRLEQLAQPRKIHPPFKAPEVYPGCLDEQRRVRSGKVREMDPVVLERLTRPRRVMAVEEVEHVPLPVVVRRRKVGSGRVKGKRDVEASFEAGLNGGGTRAATVGSMGSVGQGEAGRRLSTGLKSEGFAQSQVFVDMFESSTEEEPSIEMEEKVDTVSQGLSPAPPAPSRIEPTESTDDPVQDISSTIVDEAAVKLQSTFDSTRAQTEETESIDLKESQNLTSTSADHLADDKEQTAAIKLQSTFRGYSMRKKLTGREEVALNLRIQGDTEPNGSRRPSQNARGSANGSKRSSLNGLSGSGRSSLAGRVNEPLGVRDVEEVAGNFKGNLLMMAAFGASRSIMELNEEDESGGGGSGGVEREFQGFGGGLAVLPLGVDAHSARISRAESAVDQPNETRGDEGSGSFGNPLGLGGKLAVLPSGIDGHSARISAVSEADQQNQHPSGEAADSNREETDFTANGEVPASENPASHLDERQTPQGQSIRGSVSILKNASPPSKSSRNGSLRESIAKSIHGSATRISSAFGLGSKKSLSNITQQEKAEFVELAQEDAPFAEERVVYDEDLPPAVDDLIPDYTMDATDEIPSSNTEAIEDDIRLDQITSVGEESLAAPHIVADEVEESHFGHDEGVPAEETPSSVEEYI
ncbi:hypothetical protein HDU98_002802 [Podochytrium sp. JEL0797]|nr:hypothetical protein HDU98_002802 [Podochytrium sp. JEL0797]